MFKRKTTTTVVELSDATRQALAALDEDTDALVSLTREVIANQRRVIALLAGEIVAREPEPEPEPVRTVRGETGVRVFADENRVEDRDRVRDTPFRRRPRTVQVAWLLSEVLADGEWHSANAVAAEHADDARELRYLRHAIGARFRELLDEGVLERRPSQVRGVMFEYRKRR